LNGIFRGGGSGGDNDGYGGGNNCGLSQIFDCKVLYNGLGIFTQVPIKCLNFRVVNLFIYRWVRRMLNISDMESTPAEKKINWDFGANTPACATPDLLRTVQWKHLKPDQFACASQIVSNATTSIELKVCDELSI